MVLRSVLTVAVASGVEVPVGLHGDADVSEVDQQACAESALADVFFNGHDHSTRLDLIQEVSRWRILCDW
jgi:hypothetical protein